MFKRNLLILTMILLFSILFSRRYLGATADSKIINVESGESRAAQQSFDEIIAIDEEDYHEIAIQYVPLIPPLKEYFKDEDWDARFFSDYIAVDIVQFSEASMNHIATISPNDIQALIGDISTVAQLDLSKKASASESNAGEIYGIELLSGVKYVGEKHTVYLGIVKLNGVDSEQVVILGNASKSIANRTVWLSEQGGQHQLNKVTFICGEVILGLVGSQPVDELVEMTAHIHLNQELTCQ